nr:NACHT domain-containing protein [Ochrobactrum sp. UNC390CL2Tsu3S39]
MNFIDNTKDIANSKLSEVAAKYIEDFFSFGKKYIDKRFLRYFQDFKPYLERIYEKCSTLKIPMDRDRLYSIDDIYVNGTFSSSGEKYDDDHIIKQLLSGKKLVVQGSGGIGKTVLTKKIALEVLRSKSGKIPILIELRKVNEISNKNLSAYIRIMPFSNGTPLSEEVYNEFIREGRFVLLFDGFDELSDEYRKEIQAQILHFSFTYPKCGIIVSSRNDDRFMAWEKFELFHAAPFSKNQVRAIVERVHFNKTIKKKFITEILDKQYKQYSTFLSTPLLSLLMLFTYDKFGEVPEKVHIFYRYAFLTLYSLHDASKEAFQRKRKTNLNEDEFSRIFSIFCLLTYKDGKQTFDKTSLTEAVKRAIDRSNINVPVENFIEEATESVNLLYKEGDIFTFSHRSFQEYFSALALVTVFQDMIAPAVKFLMKNTTDSVMMMMYEMNPDLIEKNYIIPEFEKHKDHMDYIIKRSTSYEEILTRTDSHVIILEITHDNNDKIGIFSVTPRSEDYNYVSSIIQFTGNKFFRETKVDLIASKLSPLKRYITSFLNNKAKRKECDFLALNVSLTGQTVETIGRSNTDSESIAITHSDQDSIDLIEKILSKEKNWISDFTVYFKAQYVFATKEARSIKRKESLRQSMDDELLLS